MTMQTVMFVAQSSGSEDVRHKPISADEVWDFCAHGFAAELAENHVLRQRTALTPEGICPLPFAS